MGAVLFDLIILPFFLSKEIVDWSTYITNPSFLLASFFGIIIGIFNYWDTQRNDTLSKSKKFQKGKFLVYTFWAFIVIFVLNCISIISIRPFRSIMILFDILLAISIGLVIYVFNHNWIVVFSFFYNILYDPTDSRSEKIRFLGYGECLMIKGYKNSVWEVNLTQNINDVASLNDNNSIVVNVDKLSIKNHSSE